MIKSSPLKSFRRRAKQSWVAQNPAIVLTVGAVLSALATYFTMAQSSRPLGPDPQTVSMLLLIDLIFLLALTAVIFVRLLRLWIAHRQGSVGSRLQTRIVIWFSLITLVPTIAVATFSTLFFSRGIHAWFDERISTAIESSVVAAEGYLKEHRKNIRADILAMANDLNRQAETLSRNPLRLKQVLGTQAALRALTEAFVFQRRDVLTKQELTFPILFDFDALPPDALERADQGEVIVLTSDDDDRVRALIKLHGYFDTYLLVGRFVESGVLEHMQRARGANAEYQRLKLQASDLQITFSLVFAAIALLLLLVAIWAGMLFASALVRPISALVSATERVKAGDFDTRVEERAENDEIGTLGRAFNRMTAQIKKQRDELIEATRQSDARRRFIEAVLSGVSAGVIALDREQRITLCNRSVIDLLGLMPETVKLKPLREVLPEITALLDTAAQEKKKTAQDHLTIAREKGKLTLLVRIVAEMISEEIEGYVVTFDDVTALEAAQRRAAWSDVARRIAHEIKNPLTPIHLAAERLRTKYGKAIDDSEGFQKYTNTIIRHVGEIGRMVEEFVQFARLPSPTLVRTDLCTILHDTVFSQKVANPTLKYDITAPKENIWIHADGSQLSQAITNLLKNAAEALLEQKNPPKKGRIRVNLSLLDNQAILTIEDNGPGFPENLMDTITEPYVTTREKGTGLGLAIVRRIITDHGGTLSITNITSPKGKIMGAKVAVTLPFERK